MKGKIIICRRFYRTIHIALLGCVLFSGTHNDFASAEVQQAYRRPSEADLKWLFEGQPTTLPKPSTIVQTGFRRSNCEPCKRVGLPMPPIPPAPNVVQNVSPVGIAPLSESRVVQMSGERLPPPVDVPKEPVVFQVPSMEPTPERLPHPTSVSSAVPSNRELPAPQKYFSPVPIDEDLTCQPRSGGVRDVWAALRNLMTL